MKKYIKIILIFMLYIGILCIATKVEAGTGTIIKDTVILREKATTDSEILVVLPINQEVEVNSKEGDWYKVKYKNGNTTYEGYVRNDLIKVSEESNENKDNNSNNSEKENNNEEQKTTEVIEVRENTTITIKNNIEIKILPLINSTKIGTINEGSQISVLEIIGNWCHVQTDNINGWILRNKLNNSSKNDSESKKETENTESSDKTSEENKDTKKEETTTKPTTSSVSKTMYVSANILNLRKEASSDSEVIDQLSLNDKVTVVEEVDGTWSKIQMSGKSGYVATKYLSTKQTETTSRSKSEARTSTNTANTKEVATNNNNKEVANQNTEVKQTETTQNTSNTETKNDTVVENKTEESTTPQANVTESSNKLTGEDVVAYAKQFLGYRYVYATAGPNTFDCSGFTQYVYKHFGYSLYRTASDQRKNGIAVSKSDLRAGDIVCFNGHVGLYIGGGQFIHAENSRTGVVISKLSQKYYTNNYITARRIIY